MARTITNIKKGDDVEFKGRHHVVKRVYPGIAYLEDDDKVITCVCLGELVVAGLEPSAVNVIPKMRA